MWRTARPTTGRRWSAWGRTTRATCRRHSNSRNTRTGLLLGLMETTWMRRCRRGGAWGRWWRGWWLWRTACRSCCWSTKFMVREVLFISHFVVSFLIRPQSRHQNLNFLLIVTDFCIQLCYPGNSSIKLKHEKIHVWLLSNIFLRLFSFWCVTWGENKRHSMDVKRRWGRNRVT